MPIFDNILADLGNIGNAAGIQGDNPGGLNMLQRATAGEPNVAANAANHVQTNLSALTQNPDYIKADDATKWQMLGHVTGDPGAVQKANESKQLQNVNLQSPNLPNQMIQSPAVASAIGSVAPILSQMNLVNLGSQQYDTNGKRITPVTTPQNAQNLPSSGAQLPTGHPLNANTYLPSLFKWESDNNATAVGDGGKAIGLGQLHADAAAEGGIDPKDRADPAQNTIGSRNYLQKQLDTFGDPYTALVAYNFGPTATKGWLDSGGDPQNLPPAVRNYPANASGGKITAPQSIQKGNTPPPSPSDFNPPSLSDRTQDMFNQANMMTKQQAKSDNARAQVQLAEAQPDYKANAAYTENYYKTKGELAQKQGGDNIDYEKSLQGNAANGINVLNSTREIDKLGQYFDANKLAPTKNFIAQWKQALGIATPEEVKAVAAMTANEKLNYQNTIENTRQISSRPAAIEFVKLLEANPNIKMTPESRTLVIKNMQNSAQNDIDKYSTYTNWRNQTEPQVSGQGQPFRARDFENEWAKQQEATKANRIVVPESKQTPPTEAWNTTKSGNKYRVVQ